MASYRFVNDRLGKVDNVLKDDTYFVPFDMDNTDCQQFIKDWKAGAVVTDASGEAQPYSADAVKALGLTPV